MLKKNINENQQFLKKNLRNLQKFVQILWENYINVTFSYKCTNSSPKISSIDAVRVKFIENFKKYLGYSLTNSINFFFTLFLHRITKNVLDHNQLKNHTSREKVLGEENLRQISTHTRRESGGKIQSNQVTVPPHN